MKTVTDPLTVANELRPVLLKLARHLRREVHDLGVTGSQVTLLVQIKHHPRIGIRELAALEAVSAPRMSQAVDGLVSLDLVQRHPGEDRR
ncbi:MAG TPA: helix-turn-helix domain-containing protein, partial [Gaiellaceae bacterium]